MLWAIVAGTFLFRANLGLTTTAGSDEYIAAYRLVAVFMGGLIASLCLVVRRYTLQMGGGAVARVWNMVVIAGIARAASFLVLCIVGEMVAGRRSVRRAVRNLDFCRVLVDRRALPARSAAASH